MNKFLSVENMISIEKDADRAGLSYSQMMDNAGRSLASVILEKFGNLQEKKILGLIGKGNNGGDTLIALDYLSKSNWDVSAYIVGRDKKNDELLDSLNLPNGKLFYSSDDPSKEKLNKLLEEAPVVLDGLLGTGIKLPIRNPIPEILEIVEMHMHNDPPKYIIATDCPSGIDCSNGLAAKETLHVDLTVCMAAVKEGMFKFPAYEYLGQLEVVPIGLDEDLLKSWRNVQRFVADRDYVRSKLPPRSLTSHKGTFGTAMIIAGSLNYTGAALLAGQAAFRSGAGLVSMAVPEPLHAALSGHFPEAIWHLLPHKDGFIASEASDIIINNLKRIMALLIGPGFGLKDTSKKCIENLLSKQLPKLVLDADALKLVSKINEWEKVLPKNSVLTPHPGEMAELTGLSIEEIQSDRVGIAEKYAKAWNAVVVLKGAITVVASPFGKTILIPVANPALARAGTGDVLAGLIVGLLAQGMEVFDGAVAGAWLHAEAAKLAEKSIGSAAGVLAGDLIPEIPKLLK